jgi:deazaflavin-dependent oxidoreductase (nitroreductase family)
MSDDAAAWENNLLAEWRANGGTVTSGPLAGHPLLVMTSTGAKSGEPRRAILTFSRDGADYVVAGSASGAPTDPAWLQNVRSHPDVTIEAEGRTFPASATVVDDTEHARLWPQHVAALPHFGEYPAKAGRVIPVVRIRPA